MKTTPHTSPSTQRESSSLWTKIKRWIGRLFRSSNETIFSNVHATGTHKATLTKVVDAAIGSHRVVTFGDRPDSVKICEGNDIPLGCTLQETDVAGEPTTVVLCGVSAQTVRFRSGGNILPGHPLVVADAGTLKPLPEEPEGHPWIVGISLTAAQNGEFVEVATTVPYKA
jgi:hypothetical protein